MNPVSIRRQRDAPPHPSTLKLNASHRDAAGMAEVHELDTDIVYVLEGTATLVTGGTVQEGRTTAPAEIRGVTNRLAA